jgi:hypothetical protein
MSKLTFDDFQDVLRYDASAGTFTWISRVSKAVKTGDLAGNASVYITIGYKGKIYKAHRLAWLFTHGKWPNGLIDHINGDKHDNRIDNLRVVMPDGNSQNVRKPNRRNKSGFMGVIRFQNKWRASITVNGKTRRIGDYITPEEAHEAYLNAKRKYHAVCSI